MTHSFDALIVGAGAAGLMCAIEAGKRGRRVAVIERADSAGKKILISGGGRCNFTNIHCRPEHFLSANPHFPKSALARYTPDDFIGLVEKYDIPYHEKKLGQLFCDRSAKDITRLLESECQAVGVRLILNSRIAEVSRPSQFVVRTQSADFCAPILVVATGGLSIPGIGATDFGYQIARQFGLALRPTRPALVPFLLTTRNRSEYCDLAGISFQARIAAAGHSFLENVLITHRGLSGPAILQISSYWDRGQPIRIDLAPGYDIAAPLRLANTRNVAGALAALREVLPSRLATRWLELHAPSSWTNSGLQEWERLAHEWEIVPEDTEGYKKAEVTAGGVDTDELSSKTMEAHKVPGLFFIGEVVDVTGHLGGYNFQWAWASGAAAGRAL